MKTPRDRQIARSFLYSAYGSRTRVTGVRGRRPRPLDECAVCVPVPELKSPQNKSNIAATVLRHKTRSCLYDRTLPLVDL